MSEFQDYATELVIPYIFKGTYIDFENSYWEKEHHVVYGWHQYGRQDIYAHIQYKNGGYKNICIEIKSGSMDFESGNGLNFTEDYNFLLFKAGHNRSNGALRTKHLKTLDDDIGILVIVNEIVYCLRSAKPKSINEKCMKNLFSLQIGEKVEYPEAMLEYIDQRIPYKRIS